MKDHISDRTLERLRLGEFDEKKSNELFSKLEARGELHRFEALVEDDERFLETYPADMLAARVIDTARRKKTPIKEPKMLTPRRQYPLIGSVLGVLIVGAFTVYTYSVRPPPEAVPVVIERTGLQTPPDPKPAGVPFSVTVKSYNDAYAIPERLYIGLGKITTLSLSGHHGRPDPLFEVTNNSVLDISGSDDVLYLEAKTVGEASLTFRGTPDITTRVIVGERIEGGELQRVAESEPNLYSCRTHAPNWSGVAKLTIVAHGERNFVGHTLLSGLESGALHDLTWCLGSIVDKWPKIADELSVGTLNFDFGSGGTCEPGKDC